MNERDFRVFCWLPYAVLVGLSSNQLSHPPKNSICKGGCGVIQKLLQTHNLAASMSRRGNCHDNAVVESVFQLLKRERIRCRAYNDRAEARHDVFDEIEFFYNPKCKHGNNGLLSAGEFERQQNCKAQGAEETRAVQGAAYIVELKNGRHSRD